MTAHRFRSATISNARMPRMVKHPTSALLLVLAISAFTTVAQADTKACAQAARNGQLLRDSGKLVESRAAFVSCAQSSCPRVIQKDCAQWQSEVDVRTPTVVLAARDPKGARISDVPVTVTVDGQPFTTKLDGRSQLIDPGERKLRFEASGYESVDTTVRFIEGERARVVEVTMKSTKPQVEEPDGKTVVIPPPPTETTRPALSPLPFVFAGVAVVGVGVFAGLFLTADSEYSDRERDCSPNCTDAQVDPIRTKLTLSYVALGLGAAAAATSVVLFATSGTSGSKVQVRGRMTPGWAGLELAGAL